MNSTTPYEKLLAAKLDQVPVPHLEDSIWASIGARLDALGGMPDHQSGPDQHPDNTPDNHPDNAPDNNQHTMPDNHQHTPENNPDTTPHHPNTTPEQHPDTTPDNNATPAPENAVPAQATFPKSWSWYGLGGIAAITAITAAVWCFNPKPNQSSIQKITTDTTQQIIAPAPVPLPDTIPQTDTMQITPVSPLPTPSSPANTPEVKDSIMPVPESESESESESGPQRVLPLFVPDSLPTKAAPPAIPVNTPVPVKPAPPKPRGVKGITSDDYKISVIKDSTKREQ